MSYHSSSIRVTQAPPKNLEIVLINAMLGNKAYQLEVSYWITIVELKQKIEKNFGIPVANQRLFFKTQELNQNNFSMISFGNKKRIKIILRPVPKLENTLGLIKQYETFKKSKTIEGLIFHVQKGFNLELIPKLSFEGTSGTYFLHNEYRKPIAIFKPFDEEPFTPNNPRDYIGKIGSPSFKPGILSGESAVREVACYLIDHAHGRSYSGVPPTTFVEIVHPYFSNRDMKEKEISQSSIIPIQNFSQYVSGSKTIIKHGSLQAFVQGAEEASNYGPNKFPDAEVRKIAILDLRILNCDRNEGNILVRKGKEGLELIPIDHGLSFPDRFEACVYDIVWMEWPQVKKSWAPLELDYISRIDPKADIEKISRHFKFRDICLRNFRIAETVLKKFALVGLSLYEIGAFMYRDDPDFPSPLEMLIDKTAEFHRTMKSTALLNSRNLDNESSKDKPLRLHSLNQGEKEFIHDSNANGLLQVRNRRSYSFGFEVDDLNPQDILHTIIDEPHNGIEKESGSDLFTIPELGKSGKNGIRPLQRQFSTATPSNRLSFVSKNDSVDMSVEEAASEKEESDGAPEDQMNPLILKRSASIPAQITKHFESPRNEKEEDEADSKAKDKKAKRTTKNHKKEKVVPPHKDELFFKYFEAFLDQRIEIMLKNKKSPNRTRFLS